MKKNNPKLLFSTGSARGGTGLVTRMLSVSPKVEIALDPFLDLFKAFRSSIVSHFGSSRLKDTYLPSEPFQDYYFRDEGIEMLDLIGSSVDLPVTITPELISSLQQRAAYSSGDLVSRMAGLKGETFAQLLESAFELVQTARPKSDLEWTGIHENWVAELMQPLARIFPEAKFVMVLRDPRAVISSNLKANDPSMRGQIVSYARCLRKMMALALYYKTLPVFKGKLFVIRYEDLVTQPERHCQALCDFLRVDYFSNMLDTDKYVEPATGGVYNGFSNYESKAQDISPHRISRWKKHLSLEQAALIEYLCGPEMKLWGYETDLDPCEIGNATLLKTLLEESKKPAAWRTDFGFPQNDFGYEMFRRLLLKTGTLDLDTATIRKSFLFTEVFSVLGKSA